MIALGTLCVVVGVIALFVPIMPTTPFLVLAAFFYAHGSQKFLNWLLNNRWFGENLRNYREGRGLPRRTKISFITTLWFSIGVSATLFAKQFWCRLLLVLIGVAFTTHLLLLKNYKPETREGHPEK